MLARKARIDVAETVKGVGEDACDLFFRPFLNFFFGRAPEAFLEVHLRGDHHLTWSSTLTCNHAERGRGDAAIGIAGVHVIE